MGGQEMATVTFSLHTFEYILEISRDVSFSPLLYTIQ